MFLCVCIFMFSWVLSNNTVDAQGEKEIHLAPTQQGYAWNACISTVFLAYRYPLWLHALGTSLAAAVLAVVDLAAFRLLLARHV